MKKQVRKQKGFSPIIAIIAVGVVVVIMALFLSTQRTETQPTTQNVPAIQNANDLNTVASELDNADLNAVDKELNQLDADASTF